MGNKWIENSATETVAEVVMNRDIVAALLVLFVGLTAGPSLDTIKRAPWAELRGEFTIASKLVQEATRRGVIP